MLINLVSRGTALHYFFGYSARVSAQQMIHQMRSEDDHDADTDAIESDVPC